MSARQEARRTATKAVHSRTLARIARIGFAANGLMHLLIGYIAVRIAFHQGGDTDQSGAFGQLMKLPGGRIALWVAVAGLAALGLWLLLQAGLGIGSSSKKRWVRSLVSLGKAAAYFALAWTALAIVLSRPSDSASSSRQASRTVLALPGGQVLLVCIGVLTAGIGCYLIYKGLRQKFRSDIALPGGRSERIVIALAMTGYIAKGIAIILVGVLFVVAALKVKPSDASGLDGALKSLTALPFGEAILVVVGVGIIAYGLYSFARARLAVLH